VRSVARVAAPPFRSRSLVVHQHALGDLLVGAVEHADREPHRALIIGPSPGCHRIHAADSASPVRPDVSADFGRVQAAASVAARSSVAASGHSDGRRMNGSSCLHASCPLPVRPVAPRRRQNHESGRRVQGLREATARRVALDAVAANWTISREDDGLTASGRQR
jgi:hypothetical protein